MLSPLPPPDMSHRRSLDDSEEETSYSAEAVTAYATVEVLKEHELYKPLLAALLALEPHLDAIVCYASTMNEHEPNRLAFNARAALEALGN